MLNLLLGRAGTGKTDYIMNEIKRRMSAGESGMLLIVPEQYSHDAERQLCEVCGDRLSLHAETLSFTRLCNNVLMETGKTQHKILVVLSPLKTTPAACGRHPLRERRGHC